MSERIQTIIERAEDGGQRVTDELRETLIERIRERLVVDVGRLPRDIELALDDYAVACAARGAQAAAKGLRARFSDARDWEQEVRRFLAGAR